MGKTTAASLGTGTTALYCSDACAPLSNQRSAQGGPLGQAGRSPPIQPDIVVKNICAYCLATLGDTEPLADERVSHGICSDCERHFSRQLDGLSLGEYLDDFPHPVIAIDGDGRVLAANQQMAARLGVEQRELRGLLGGNVLECARARLPGGCGQTVHCSACTVRLALRHTIDTGESLYRVPAYVKRAGGRLDLWISTRSVGDVVKVVIGDRAA